MPSGPLGSTRKLVHYRALHKALPLERYASPHTTGCTDGHGVSLSLHAGNLLSKTTDSDQVSYAYNAAGKMVKVSHADKTSVAFAYDAFGRKARRTETGWTVPGSPFDVPPGLTDARGWGNNSEPGSGQRQEPG